MSGSDLAKAERSARTQEQVIMDYFTANAGSHTPEQVHAKAGLLHCPITSIRRSITNLTNAGKLIKTEQMVNGNWGKPVHLWTLPSDQLQLF
jgi:predicted transcriptional regulator